MLLVFEDSHKEHLSFLVGQEAEVLKEFCRISLNFIRSGSNPKVFTGAAQKLGVAANDVQHGVEGLMYLFTESARLMLSDIDFNDSIMTLGFEEATRSTLCEVYLAHRRDIRDILGELASRSLRHQTSPNVLLKLDTEEDGERQTQLLTSDPVNLAHLTRVLEGALQEMKSGYCRRIARNIK